MDLAVVSKYIEAMTRVLKNITPQSISANTNAGDIAAPKNQNKPIDTQTGQQIDVNI